MHAAIILTGRVHVILHHQFYVDEELIKCNMLGFRRIEIHYHRHFCYLMLTKSTIMAR
jgi:hypothetical protein